MEWIAGFFIGAWFGIMLMGTWIILQRKYEESESSRDAGDKKA